MKTQVETIATEQPPPLGRSTVSPKAKSFVQRGVKVGFLVFFLVVSTTTIVTFLLPKTYLGVARLLVETEKPDFIRTEIAIGSSDAVLGSVARVWAQARANHYGLPRLSEFDAIAQLKERLRIQAVGNSSLVAISFYSSSPYEAAEIANQIAERYATYPRNQSTRILFVDKAVPNPRPHKPNIVLNLAAGVFVGAFLGLLSGLMTASFSRRSAIERAQSAGEPSMREADDKRQNYSHTVAPPSQPWMKWLGAGLVSLGIPVGIFGLVMLYLVLQDKSWNPAPSEVIVCFSAWIGTFGLFIAGCVLVKISRSPIGQAVKSLIYTAAIMVLILAVGLSVEWSRQTRTGNSHAPSTIAVAQPNGASSIPKPVIKKLESPAIATLAVPSRTISPKEIAESPKLRFVAWQDEWTADHQSAVRHPDGLPVTNATELKWLEQISPVTQKVSNLKLDPELRFLHIWFSHPLFGPANFNEVTLLDEQGRIIPSGSVGSSSNARPGDLHTGDVGWLTYTIAVVEGTNHPMHATVRLRYAVGPLEKMQQVAVTPKSRTSMTLEGGGQLSGLGQTVDGTAFISLIVDREKLGDRKFGAVALTKDGRELLPSGGDSTATADGKGTGAESFEFAVPLEEVANFRIGTRAIRIVEWKDVVLPPFK